MGVTSSFCLAGESTATPTHASSSPLGWVERGLERDIVEMLQQRRRQRVPTWLFVRGRRQAGKTQLIQKALATLPNKVFVKLNKGTVLANFAEALHHPVSTATDLADALMRRIRDKEMIVVIDEIQHANAAEQGILQGVVDSVKGAVLHGGYRTAGGMILLGSHTQRADDINMGFGAPLWDRMTQHRTVLPFQPEEMAIVFHRHHIISSRTRLYISSLTGGYPAQLVLLAEAGALRDDVTLAELLKALAKHEKALASVFEDELGLTLSSVARIVVQHSDLSKGIAVAKKALQTGTPGQGCSDAAIESYIRRLEGYGVVRRLLPMFPILSRAPRDEVIIWDPRWAWYDTMRGRRAVPTVDGVQDVLLTVNKDQERNVHRSMGDALERRVAELIRARSRLAHCPVIPAWTLDQSGNTVPLTLSTKSTPHVLDGKQVGYAGELDGMVVFLAERIVVYFGCKVSCDALFEELKPLPPMALQPSPTSMASSGLVAGSSSSSPLHCEQQSTATPSASASNSASFEALSDVSSPEAAVGGHGLTVDTPTAQGGIQTTRTQTHAASLRATLAALQRPAKEGDTDTVEEIADVLVHPETQSHYVFVAADDSLRTVAGRFLAQLPAKSNMWFASLADLYSGFPFEGERAVGPPGCCS